MRKTITATLVAAFALTALAGCSDAEAGGETTATAAADTNRQACSEFGNTTTELGKLITTSADELGGFEAYQNRLDAVPDRFDKAALAATGDVAERMSKAVDELPDRLDTLALESDDYSANVRSVYNACEAGGYPVESFATLE